MLFLRNYDVVYGKTTEFNTYLFNTKNNHIVNVNILLNDD